MAGDAAGRLRARSAPLRRLAADPQRAGEQNIHAHALAHALAPSLAHARTHTLTPSLARSLAPTD